MLSPRPRFGIHIVAFASACAFVHPAVASGQSRIPPIPLAPAGETGRRVTDGGLTANYFPASGKAPAVLVLGGSVGGLSHDANHVARGLQAEGFSVLHLSYFRAPGQNPRLELIPLEYFVAALTWMGQQADVDATRMGIVGISKGAEAALLLAVRRPELKAVVAALPSSVVWPGIVWEGSRGPIESSWSENGKPLPSIRHVPYDASKGGTMADNYAESLRSVSRYPAAVIPVERIAGRILLVCGENDRVSPGCPMARQIQGRLREHGRPEATLLAYKDVGHLAFGLPLPPDDPRLPSAGGSMESTSGARADSWRKVVAFLRAELGQASSLTPTTVR